MLTALFGQLCTLLQSIGVPVYAEDAVPSDTLFPLLTLRIEPPGRLDESGSVTLTGWFRSSSPHADRLAMADRIMKLVPAGGRLLRTNGLLAALYPCGKEAVTWPESRGQLGVRIRWELRLYMAKEADHA